jgi:hypothetical protein
MGTGQRAQGGDGVHDGYVEDIDKFPEQLARPEPNLSTLFPPKNCAVPCQHHFFEGRSLFSYFPLTNVPSDRISVSCLALP